MNSVNDRYFIVVFFSDSRVRISLQQLVDLRNARGNSDSPISAYENVQSPTAARFIVRIFPARERSHAISSISNSDVPGKLNWKVIC